MEKNYLSTANSIIPVVYSKEDQALALKFKEQATLIGNRTVDLDHLIKQVDDGIGTKLQTTKLDPSYMQNIVDVFSSTEDATILFPYRNKIKDTPEKIELADLSVKRRQLQKAREELGTIYSKMLEPNKGFKDYKAAPEGKRTQLYAPKSEKKKELSLHDNFTPEEFDDYIERKSAYLSYAEKIKFSKSSFYSDAINLLRKYLKSKGTNVATATSIQKFLEKIVKEKITMYPDEVQRLIAKVSGFAQIVDAAIVKAEDRKDTINSQISGLEAVGNLGEEYFNLSDEYAELEDEIIPELQNIQAVSNTFAPLLEKVQALEGFNDFPAEQSAFREAAVEELLTGTKRQIEASRFDGETIDPDYTDLRGVKFNITYLETLLDKALKSSREFSGKATEVRKLISNLKKIEKLVKENIADKERKNQKENEYYAQGAVDVLESIPNLPELLSSEQLSKLAELKKENLGLAGAASVDLLASLDKDVSQSVLAKVKMEAFELLNNLKVFQIKTALGKEWGEQHVTRILNSPSKGFQQVYVDLLDKENKVGGAANLTPLANFVKSYDVVTFLSEVSKFEGITSKEELIEIVKLQAKLIALEQISRAIETDSSYMEFYTRVQRYLEASKSEIYPSTAQIRVIRELSLFVDGPVNAAHEMFQNIAALKAPAGAGKSVVVAPALRAISKLDSDEILTAASQKLAADNINKSLGSSNNSSNIEELTALLNANTIPEKVKLIVVDEAGVMNKKELTLLAAAFAKRNRQNPQNSVKMVFLYDPNQITPGNTSFAALDYSAMGEPSKAAKDYHESNDEKIRLQYRLGEKIYSADFSSLPFIENIYNITPLSTTYRSDVSEIVDLQNTFKTTGPVENVNTAATSNPLNNVKDIKGTFVEGGNNIAKVFQSSQEANPSRSRVIIVGSSVKRDDYKKLLPNAEVLTSLEAIGITRDEVYVDILPTDGGYLNSPSVYNDHMYTATSRGVLFVHLSNTRGDFQIDPTIDERLSKTKKDRVGSKKNAIETLKSDIKTLEDITGKVAAPQEETKKETPVALTETEETGDVIEPPSDIVIGGSIDNGFHSLQHPDSNTLTEQGDIPALKAGDEVILVKDISNGQTRYVVLQPINNSDYRRIAILGDNEISSFERNTGLDNIAGLEGYDFELGAFNDPRGQVIKPKDGLILSYKKLFIQPSTKDLTYQYANTSVEDFSGDVDKEGRLVKLSVFTRFLETK